MTRCAQLYSPSLLLPQGSVSWTHCLGYWAHTARETAPLTFITITTRLSELDSLPGILGPHRKRDSFTHLHYYYHKAGELDSLPGILGPYRKRDSFTHLHYYYHKAGELDSLPGILGPHRKRNSSTHLHYH